jgi:integrase
VERQIRSGGEVVYRVRWRDQAGRNRSKVLGRKRDAEAFDAEITRRRRTGELALLDAGRETLDEYVATTWAVSHAAGLAPRTKQTYANTYDLHISPRLGGLALRSIDADVISGFQAALIRAGVGPHARRKAMTLLGGILQRAAEGRRIPYNPQRVVRKARLPMAQEVRPLAPITLERMRKAADSRDAMILSILAYAGLRPGELRMLRWVHVRERTLIINAGKTGRRRAVRLLAPLADDLSEWRHECVVSSEEQAVVPAPGGGAWSANAFEKWRQRRFRALIRAVEIERARPYDLRHSFASLLLHEGRDVIYVARQLGHGAELTLRTYGHVIEELEDAPQLPAEEAIRLARQQGGSPRNKQAAHRSSAKESEASLDEQRSGEVGRSDAYPSRTSRHL